MTYKKLDMDTMRLALITDASFANAKQLRSQLEFLILMADRNETANLIHFGSSRCRRVTRSILAAEKHDLVLGFDQAFVMWDTFCKIQGRPVKLEAYVDSRLVSDVIAKDVNTSKKCLQIDILVFRRSYANGELDRIG